MRFPEAQQDTALAGFFFLRYICPAIIAPDGYGLLDPGGAFGTLCYPPLADSDLIDVVSPTIRRNLLLISKVLQNIANNSAFSGNKETFMSPLNKVVVAHQPARQALLSALGKFLHFTPSARDFPLLS